MLYARKRVRVKTTKHTSSPDLAEESLWMHPKARANPSSMSGVCGSQLRSQYIELVYQVQEKKKIYSTTTIFEL